MPRLSSLLLVALLASGCPARSGGSTELPVLGTAPKFEFTDQNGAAFSSDALAGKVWVANFIFTRCPTICPTFTAAMGKVQKQTEELGEKIHLVTFTVDPEYDTPDKLLPYAQLHHAGPRWTFLTGTREKLEAAIVKGLMQPMDKGDGKSLMSIGHGSVFVLVDGRQQLRGFYRYNDEGSFDQLLKDAAQLAAHPDR